MELTINGIILSAVSGSMMRWFAEPDEYCISDEIAEKVKGCTDATIDIGIDSPGGDIFAAFSIINAIDDWCIKNKAGRINVYVGAMAASAAAAIVAMLPRTRSKVYVHRNSMLMFHGVHTDIFGAGAEAMADTAELLDKLNAQIKAALLARTSIPTAIVEDWFHEGREGWLTSDHAVEFGLADAVISADAEKTVLSPKFENYLNNQPKAENMKFNFQTLRTIVSNLGHSHKLNECGAEPPKEPNAPEPQGNDGAEPPKEPNAPEPQGDDGTEPPKEPNAPEPQGNDGAEPPKEPNTPEPQGNDGEDDGEIERLTKENDELKERIQELEKQLEESKAASDLATKKLNKLTGGFRATSAPNTFSNFSEALAAYRKEHPQATYNDAFCAVAKANPKLYSALRGSSASR